MTAMSCKRECPSHRQRQVKNELYKHHTTMETLCIEPCALAMGCLRAEREFLLTLAVEPCARGAQTMIVAPSVPRLMLAAVPRMREMKLVGPSPFPTLAMPALPHMREMKPVDPSHIGTMAVPRQHA